MLLFVQTWITLGIPKTENVRLEQRKFIADTVDKLGDQFRPVFKAAAAWLAYIQDVYPEEGGQVHEAPMSQSLVVADDE